LKISFDCDTKAVELAATNQVPNTMMEIYAASKKLAQVNSTSQKSRTTPTSLSQLRRYKSRRLTSGQVTAERPPPSGWASTRNRKTRSNEWWMCVDYTDLNKHCPKDPFGLPRIDQVIDSTVSCDLLCFLDCYSGYHQIAIKEEDQENTAFITPFGTYCYTTMSFGLKNAGATYQRAIQACFKRQLNKNVEAYVDDVVIKTRNSDSLIADLEETFASLGEYRWKLNSNKCVFGVPSGKLLGFIINHRSIEVNPEKISTITNMKAPTCIKDVQKLTGCMAALNRFISKLGERGLHFLKLLKHQEKFASTPEADQALAQLKDFLSKPPVLTAPRKKEQLLLYLAASTHVVSTAIVVER
jgi:hypothetical protein